METTTPPVAQAHSRRVEPRCVVTGSICLIEFFIPGKPVPKGRPRFARRGTFVQTYSDPHTVEWESHVADQARSQLAELQVDGLLTDLVLPFAGRLVGTFRFNIDKPKSYPKKIVHHEKRPDGDNLMKSVWDGLQGVVFKDDGQFTDFTGLKRYSEPGHPQGVEVSITAWL